MAGRGWQINDEARLRTMREYGIFGTPPEERYDELTAKAAELTRSPIAVINIIGDDAQWFKSRHGTDLAEPSIEHSLCVHTLVEGDTLVIPDLMGDDRTSQLPCVRSDPSLRFYAGAPIVVRGQAIGTLAVMDLDPRPAGISETEAAALACLAGQAADMIVERRPSG